MISSFKRTAIQFICIVVAIAMFAGFLCLLNRVGSHANAEASPIKVTNAELVTKAYAKTESESDENTSTSGQKAVESVAASLQDAEEVIRDTVITEVEEAQQATSPYADLLGDIDENDRETFARLIYHESRGEGGEAVAEVVLNRMLDDSFPDTFQGVVYERNQFEPADILYTAPINEPEAFDDCERIVEEVLDPNYERTLPEYYLFFNSIGPDSDDYCWLGGNVFYGYPN